MRASTRAKTSPARFCRRLLSCSSGSAACIWACTGPPTFWWMVAGLALRLCSPCSSPRLRGPAPASTRSVSAAYRRRLLGRPQGATRLKLHDPYCADSTRDAGFPVDLVQAVHRHRAERPSHRTGRPVRIACTKSSICAAAPSPAPSDRNSRRRPSALCSRGQSLALDLEAPDRAAVELRRPLRAEDLRARRKSRVAVGCASTTPTRRSRADDGDAERLGLDLRSIVSICVPDLGHRPGHPGHLIQAVDALTARQPPSSPTCPPCIRRVVVLLAEPLHIVLHERRRPRRP